MKPAEICLSILGQNRIEQIILELSAPQTKTILKEGEIKAKLPGGYVSQKKRRELWAKTIHGAIEQRNDALAAELLQQWLLNHRREMLVNLLDRLDVKHRAGETDETFLVTRSADKIRDESAAMLTQYEPTEVRAYLLYIAFQQRANVFDDWAPLLEGTHAADGEHVETNSASATTEPAPE